MPAMNESLICTGRATIGERGKPKMIVSDNGTEFTSNAIMQFGR